MNPGFRSANPFPGLRPFRQDEDYLFFGREDQTLELLQRLGTHRFVAVVGTSGSGKSSLVRCGLLSELLGGKMLQAGAAWEVAVTHPGGNPLALLTEALLEADLYDPEVKNARENLLATLSRSHFGLVEAVRLSGIGSDTNFLLVVDQFEEIFRFREAGHSQQEAAAEFVSLLLESVAQNDVPIYVVLTMRSDFIGECSQFEGLAEMVNQGEFLIPRLSREQYKRVIEGPIKVAGGQIAPRLLQRLLNDLGQQADQLPCLQHALMRTWDVWAKNGETKALDLEDYQRVGKMAEALSLHADEIYQALHDDRHRSLCRGLFQALTVKESEKRGIRRPQRLSSLCAILDVSAAELIPIIDAYRQHGVTFLMPPPEIELLPDTIIDISHESLMRVWSRLRQWVDEEAQSVGIYERLAESARLHAQGQAGLYRDPELGIALAWRQAQHPTHAWAESYRCGFKEAMAFLDASQRAQAAEEQAREAARQRELEQAQALAESQERSARLFKRFAAIVAGAFLVAVALSIWALHNRNQAIEATARAETSKRRAQLQEGKFWHEKALAFHDEKRHFQAKLLAARAIGFEGYGRQTQSTTFQETNPIGIDSNHERRPEIESLLKQCPDYPLLWQSAWSTGADKATATTTDSPSVRSIKLSPDGRYLAASWRNRNSIKVWDLPNGKLEAVFSEGPADANARSIRFSPDGSLLAAPCQDDRARIWDLNKRELLWVSPDLRGLRCCEFSPDGKSIITGAFSDVAFWDLETRQQTRRFPYEFGFVYGIELSQDGRHMGVGDFLRGRGGKFHFFDLESEKQLLQHDLRGGGFTLHPNGEDYCVINNPSMEVWSPDSLSNAERKPAAEFLSPTDSNYQGAPRFSPDGRFLAAAQENQVLLWDARRERLLARLGEKPSNFEFSPDGSLLAIGEANGTVNVWNLDEAVSHETIANEQGGIRAMAVSPDGTKIASAASASQTDSNRKEIIIRDRRTGAIVHRLQGHDMPVVDLAFSPSGRLLASVSQRDFAIGLWDPESGTLLRRLYRHNQSAHNIAFSQDGTLLAAVFGDGLRVWETSTWSLVSEASFDLRVIITDLCFSADGGALFVSNNEGWIQKWDAATGQLLKTSHHENGRDFLGLTISPDGRQLLAANEDGRLFLFDSKSMENPEIVRVADDLDGVAMTPNGKQIAIGLANGVIELWNANPLHKIATFSAHHHRIPHLAFTDGGKTLVSGSNDGFIKVFNLESRPPSPNYALFADGVFDLETPYVTMKPVTPDKARSLTDAYLRQPLSSYPAAWRQSASELDRNRSLFWRFFQARNWPQTFRQWQQLAANGEGEAEKKALQDERLRLAGEALTANSEEMAAWHLQNAFALGETPQAWGLKAVLSMRQGDENAARAALTKSYPEGTPLLESAGTIRSCLDAWLKQTQTPNLGKDTLAAAAFLEDYLIQGRPFDPPMLPERPARDLMLESVNEAASRVTFVPLDATWYYLDDGSPLEPSWVNPDYNDASWRAGVGAFGRGGADSQFRTNMRGRRAEKREVSQPDPDTLDFETLEAAPAPSTGTSSEDRIITYYFRHRFHVDSQPSLPHLFARLLRDDGIAVYLNGKEIIRDNLPAGPLDSMTRAIENIFDAAEYQWLLFPLDPGLIQSGDNVLAAEVHQDNPNSSDIGFHMEFYAATIDPLSYLASVPVADRLAGIGRLDRILPPSLAAPWKAELEAAYVQETTPTWSKVDPLLALARLRVKLALGKRDDVAAGLAQLEEAHRNLPQLNLVRQQMEDLRKALE